MIWGDLLLGARKQRAALALVTLVIGLGAIGLVLRSTDRADRTVNDHATELYELLRDDGEPTWQWADFDASSDLMTIDDESLHSRGLVVPIGVAHSQGLLHRGTWTAVITDEAPRRRLLLLRRASHLATCPSAWGLVGEHSEVGEQWLDTSPAGLKQRMRAKSRNRYTVEISYSRVTDWSLLADVIPHEVFHLVDSTWWWALGFSNLELHFLQPPPDADRAVCRPRS